MLIGVVETKYAGGEAVTNQRGAMLIIVGQRRLKVGLELLGGVNVLPDLTESAVDRFGHLGKDVVGHLVVVGEREHRH